MNKHAYLPLIAAVGLAASLVIAIPAFAQTQQTQNGTPGNWGNHFGIGGMRGGMNGMNKSMTHDAFGSGVFGTVSAVNGTTITVTSKMRPHATSTPATATTVTYTVDASNATIYKNGATSTIASIATGDMIMAQGTVSGTTVTATVIRDGLGGKEKFGMPMGSKLDDGDGDTDLGHGASSTPPFRGNGEPVVAGSVTAISGNTITATNASNVTYTIDATTAKIIKNGATITITNVATSDNLIVQGTVNGTNVTASSIIDQGSTSTTPGAQHQSGDSGSHGGFGFFGAIGSFFKHLFGF